MAWVGRRPVLVAMTGLGCLYLAVTSGHLQSIDGLLMYRQGLAIAYEHSLHWSAAIDWGSGPRTTSHFGLGLSLAYLPGLLLFGWLRDRVPAPAGPYDFHLLYGDPVYTLTGPVLQVLVALATAYLISRLLRELGLSLPIALWGIPFFALGSPAIVYARGDVAQPLEAFCWLAGVFTLVKARREGGHRWALLAAVIVVVAVLTRPLEGSILGIGLVLLAMPWREPQRLSSWRSAALMAGGLAAGAGLTLLINIGRFGSPLNFGYSEVGWKTPLPVGLAGSLISPGRGMLWAFPAIVLVPLGFRALTTRRQLDTAIALAGMSAALLLHVSLWTFWWGGWDWGLRLFFPAVPLLAVLAAAGIDQLRGKARVLLPPLFLIAGFLWALPGMVTDILGGYGGTYDGSGASFRWSAYPPIGAWHFLHHVRATSLLDLNAIDTLWFRLARETGNLSLVPALILTLAATTCLIGLLRARIVAGRLD